ncbi:hypothetical protein HF324_20870 [Chitinophaga oryzae]|uniref:HNH endonuclease n=1 Tax=Chitinophaga oryzae TaxID=2725414 RepID=A0ABX6LJX7_9BACT|nr:hypothetical protein [Chitinophaga oryzae]QJB40178.1 hypothetical protein HF324_20870 [Chitinophaga oryzae]
MKYCIFCGEQPQSKTKEHIIPKWLIEMTGDPNRLTFFGRYRDNQKNLPGKISPFLHVIIVMGNFQNWKL